MKLRIKGNSIRMRLTRSEVERFGKEGYLEDRTEFVYSAFRYALKAKEGISGLEADFSLGKITMYVPAGLPAEWAANDKVGYSNEMETGDGRHLSLLLEKDFKCIESSGEDQSDNYENPKAAC